jgi:arylsulfatase A-like enzyme
VGAGSVTDHVVLILADDQRADTLPYMPFVNGYMRAHGTTYTGMRCSVPICSPSRAAIATGQYAKGAANQVYENDNVDIVAPAVDALGPWLQSAGVATGMFGKYTVAGETLSPGGWDQWAVLPANTQSAYGYTARNGGGGIITPSPPEHSLNFIFDQTWDFIDDAGAVDSFAWCAPTNPHIDTALFSQNPFPPTVRLLDWVMRRPLDLLTDTSTKPSWIQALAQFSYASPEYMRYGARQQTREVYDLDAKADELWQQLVGGSYSANTTVIFASDSGVHWGEQRLGDIFTAGKGTPYDVAMRAPCVIMGPGFAAGATEARPTILQDITATILDIFGATPTVPQDGVSLRGAAAGLNSRPGILYEKDVAIVGITPATGNAVVTTTRKLVRWDATGGTDEFEMYDLDTDPTEKINVANQPGRLTERNALEAILDGLL